MAIAELRPRKITVDEYHRMVKAGILEEGERIELLDGLIVEMSPFGRAHKVVHQIIDEYLKVALRGRAIVSGQ